MKTLGLIGGTTWLSTIEYYRSINEAIIDGLAERGARGVILGCTEIPLLIRPGDCRIPTFDTTALHVDAAVKFALGDARAL